MAQSSPEGLFLPITTNLDIAELESVDVTSDRFKELLVTLVKYLTSISIAVNAKDTGIYDTSEVLTSQTYFPDSTSDSGSSFYSQVRPTIRKVINFGTLPNTTTKSVAHGITVTSSTVFTRIYATSTDPVALQYIPIIGLDISLSVDSTNVNIKTPSDLTAFTITYVVLEYIK